MFCLQVILLFVATVFMTACFHSYAHLPPVLGMMTGLGMLKVYGWWRGRAIDKKNDAEETSTPDDEEAGAVQSPRKAAPRPSSHKDSAQSDGRIGGGDGRKDHALDIFKRLEQTEWDTLIFFYGVIMCVGGLGVMGKFLSTLVRAIRLTVCFVHRVPLRVVHVHVRQLRAQRRQRGARRALRGHR